MKVLNTITHPLRVASLLATAVYGMVREDPVGFCGKAAERLRTSSQPLARRVGRWLINRLPPSHSQQAMREHLRKGNMSEAIWLGREGSRGERFLARRTEEQKEQLTSPVPQGVPLRHNRTTTPRVLFVLTNSVPFTQSGYTERSHRTLQALARAGVCVEAVTRLAYPVLVGKLPRRATQTIDGITYNQLLPARYPVSLPERDNQSVEMIVRHARAMKATVLHTTTDFKNALVVSRAAEILGIPWIYEVRGELESTWLSRRPKEEQAEAKRSEFYQLTRAQETTAMQAASAVIALSQIAQEQFIARGVPAEKITVVPNAVDSELVGMKYDQREIRKELGLNDGPLVGTVTSVVDYEGLDDFLRALVDLPKVRGLIVGDGTARPALEQLASELGIADRVTFAGRQPAETIWKWYAALDVFVVPRKDTEVCRVVTPLKALTAQALGVPVVTSDLPALREVTGGVAEYVSAEHPQDLAFGVSRAVEDRQGAQGIVWAEKRTWGTNAEIIAGLYLSSQLEK